MDDVLATAVPTSIPLWEMAVRMAVAMLFGAGLGLDRELHHKPAGLRTHMLVSIAAASFALVTLELYHQALARPESGNPDPLRVMEAVITGVAFLGAGSIIRGGGQIEGITTGASIWLAGAIGLASGSGLYTIALLATAFGIATLTLLGSLTRRVQTSRHRRPRAPEDEDREDGTSL